MEGRILEQRGKVRCDKFRTIGHGVTDCGFLAFSWSQGDTERDSYTGYNYQSTESMVGKSGMNGKGESFHHAEKEEK